MFRPYRRSTDTFAVSNAGERKVIVAAIARCAWQDEADRLYPNGGDFKSDYDRAKEYKAAILNTEAWAQWGKADGK